MRDTKDSLFTFIVEYQGHTLVEQFRSRSCADAIRLWIENTKAPVTLEYIFPGSYEGTPITGTKNVWCETVFDDNKVFYLINIVKTVC